VNPARRVELLRKTDVAARTITIRIRA
jgi:hypothetical protein